MGDSVSVPANCAANVSGAGGRPDKWPNPSLSVRTLSGGNGYLFGDLSDGVAPDHFWFGAVFPTIFHLGSPHLM